ncbi:MAG: hypothetical protein D6820_12305 [Lentisphaerae bacterium]|nr:MAG: hypothetical protein D6820_12305 [Lentisphaerota bacterium]
MKNLFLLLIAGVIWWGSPGFQVPGKKMRIAVCCVIGLCMILAPWGQVPDDRLRGLEACLQKMGKQNALRGHRYFVFLSAACEHCQALAERIREEPGYRSRSYLFILGEPEEVSRFIKETGSEGMPYCVLKPAVFFSYVNLGPPPAVYEMKNGRIVGRLSSEELERWPVAY